MNWILHSRPQTIAAIVALVGMAAMGFVPQFGGPGYESALGAGLLLPTLSAVASAFDQARRRSEPFDAFSRGAASGTILALVGYAVVLLHGLRAGFCDVGGGTVTYFLGPFVGTVMGGVWGSLAGETAGYLNRSRWQKLTLAFALAVLGPAMGIATSIWRFFSTPIIFAFDPFFGYFSGAIYDTVVDSTDALLTYRLGSALTLVAAAILCAHLGRSEDGKPVLRSLHRGGISLLGAVCATASLVLVLEGHRLGHWQTAATIEREMGARVSGARCDVVYSRAINEASVRLFARDCDEQAGAVERYFDARDSGRITAYLFQSGAEKRRLMGALHTSIAKPWRREVYVQLSGYPHPILAHEIAHIVAGSFARGPLKIAGSLRGIVPNPGLIEGVAVAAAPDEDQLTPAQWSRAMLELKILPSPDTIFTLGFFGQNSATAYTAAGAFVGFVRETYGPQAVRRWYGGEDLSAITGAPPLELRERFKDYVRKEPLPDVARAIAKARFDRPSVWGRRCPHDVDRSRVGAAASQEQGDCMEAVRTYRRMLELDPRDDDARLGIARCSLRRNQEAHAKTELASLADDENVVRPVRDRALMTLADLAMQDGDYDRAAERYAALGARTLDEDVLRTLEVKTTALGDPRARRAISALLVGSSDRGVDLPTAAALLGAWIGEDPTDGLPEYLLGRDLASRGLYDEAAARLDRALAKRLAAGRVLGEALRQRVIVACALQDVATAKKAFSVWLDKGGEKATTRVGALRHLVERCTGEEPSPL